MSSDEVELDPAKAAGSGNASPVAGPVASASVAEAAAASSVAGSPSAEIAEALAAGRIDAAAAQDLLIDKIAQEQLPPEASPEARAALVEQLRALLAGDPTLASLLG